MKYKIKNATVIVNDDSGTVLTDAQITTQDEKIKFVGSTDDLDEGYDLIIDASSNIVCPGFFNTHTHIPMTLFRCYADDMVLSDWLYNKIFPAEDKLTDEMVYWASLAALIEMTAGGTVCINDMYSNCGAIMKAIEQSGIKAAVGRGIVCFDPDGTRERIREMHELYEQYNKPGQFHITATPHAQYTTNEETLKYIADFAAKNNMRIHTHISETKKEHEECKSKTGMTPIAYMESLGLMEVPFIGAHCVWIDDNDINILQKHDATVASCPRSNLKLASGIAPLGDFSKAGINVALGTDGAASNNRLSMLSEAAVASLVQKGVNLNPTALPAEETLKLATVNGAKALGFNSGVIANGYDADIIMLNNGGIRYYPQYNPVSSLIYAADDTSVCLTMANGNVLYNNGVCMFADVGEVKERLNYYGKVISR